MFERVLNAGARDDHDLVSAWPSGGHGLTDSKTEQRKENKTEKR